MLFTYQFTYLLKKRLTRLEWVSLFLCLNYGGAEAQT